LKTEKVVIVGAGPSGIAAAIQLQRFGYRPVVIERSEPGGLLKNAHWVENYPGFPGGISGLELVRRFRDQLKAHVKCRRETVLSADHRNGIFVIKTSRRTLTARILVVATGTEPKKIFSDRVQKTLDGRLYYEPWSLPRRKGRRIAIIGAGDAAFDYALGLVPGNIVMIIGRGSQPRCLPVLWRSIRAIPDLKYFGRSRVESIGRDERSINLRLTGGKNLQADYVLVAAGRKPCLGFLTPNLRRKFGHLIRTKKLWRIGDVKNRRYRQIGISVGDGIRCAMEIAGQKRRPDR
jgi:thioredoxin reductase (NADPH)